MVGVTVTENDGFDCAGIDPQDVHVVGETADACPGIEEEAMGPAAANRRNEGGESVLRPHCHSDFARSHERGYFGWHLPSEAPYDLSAHKERVDHVVDEAGDFRPVNFPKTALRQPKASPRNRFVLAVSA